MTENEKINVLKHEINDILELAEKNLQELQIYRNMEERLKKIYGECDGLLEVVVRNLEKHEGSDFTGGAIKSRLLTDEDVDKWNEYKATGTVEEFKTLKNAEKEGLFLKLPVAIGSEVWKIVTLNDDFSGPYKIASRDYFRVDMLKSIGKTVFLTYEEANTAIEKIQ